MDRIVWSVRSLMVITVAVQVVALTAAAPPADLISSLPGQPEVDFKQYSGYINIDQSKGKSLFYYFTEAANSSATKPLVLWLNGGPGCSSLGGAFAELGPFNPNSSGNGLIMNNGSWNQVANMIFLESPVGVGFSYTNETLPRSSDESTAADSVAFLLEWLKEYPEYNSNDFYVTGESYGGHYVPQLAAAILENNRISGQPQIRLKGILVGNPLFDFELDNGQSRLEYAYGHGMISEAAYQAVVSDCYNGSSATSNGACSQAQLNASAQGGYFTGYINPYDVIADLCSNGEILAGLQKVQTETQFTADPCIYTELATYLNLKEVQSALHANLRTWVMCTSGIYNSSDEYTSIAPILTDLLNSNLRVWIYSGDADIVIPFIGTRRIVSGIADTLKLNSTSTYRQWFQGSQVGGWSVSWGSLLFATVRGAGHMVPQTAPDRALVLISSFLAGDRSLPSVPS